MSEKFLKLHYPKEKNKLSTIFLESLKKQIPYLIIEELKEITRITLSYEMTGSKVPGEMIQHIRDSLLDKAFLYSSENYLQIIVPGNFIQEAENILLFFEENQSKPALFPRKEKFLDTTEKIFNSFREILDRLSLSENDKKTVISAFSNAHELYKGASLSFLWEIDNYPFKVN